MQSDMSFGRWLKQRRKALDLTQDDLARQVGCSVVTIRKIEVDERRPSRQIAELLAHHLAILPHERSAFLQFARGDTGSSLRLPADAAPKTPRQPEAWQLQKHPTNLERPLTPLIGRTAEVLALRQLVTVGATRLITVTGPGGIGKTRLTTEVAAGLLDNFSDGVFLVPLESVFNPQRVVAAIEQTLGIAEVDQEPSRSRVLNFLRDKHLLLILDNFEQILSAAPLVTELLSACPWLYMLVTSRAALHVRGERLFLVPSLDLPGTAQHLPPDSAVKYGAIALFNARAQEAYPRWTLSEQNLAAVVAICRVLDGLPLAIELAASRSRVLSPQDMLRQISAQSALLKGGFRDLPSRQQTLRGTIDWSYVLLDPASQRLFARLGIFNGGWTLQAALTICEDVSGAAGSSILDGLLTLVDQSLVRQETTPEGEARYVMLHTIREYAYEKLVDSGDLADLQARHLRYFLAMAETAEPHLCGGGQHHWVARLEHEHDNLQSALAYCCSLPERTLDGLRLAGALGEFWFIRAYLLLGRGWLQALLEQRQYEPTPIYAKALRYAGVLAGAQGDTPQALLWHDAAIQISRALGDTKGLAYALIDRWALQESEDPDAPELAPLLPESLALARAARDPWLRARVTWRLGVHYYYTGRHQDQAPGLLEESLAQARIADDRWCISNILPHLSNMAWERGDYDRANTLAEEALGMARALGNQRGLTNTLNTLARVAVVQRDPERAEAYLVESLDLARSVGLGLQTAVALRLLGRVALQQGAVQQAERLCIESLLRYHQIDNTYGYMSCLLDLARIAQLTGQAERKVWLLSALDALLRATHTSLFLPDREEYEALLAEPRVQLDAELWQRAWNRGQHTPLDQVITEVLETFNPWTGPTRHIPHKPSGLD
ncbi:MAG: tetratricopeptide repeat protein [Chloroflexi bacterium]|nr:tetratricopeptide repeat protein [Chloroflexota bacterium]